MPPDVIPAAIILFSTPHSVRDRLCVASGIRCFVSQKGTYILSAFAGSRWFYVTPLSQQGPYQGHSPVDGAGTRYTTSTDERCAVSKRGQEKTLPQLWRLRNTHSVCLSMKNYTNFDAVYVLYKFGVTPLGLFRCCHADCYIPVSRPDVFSQYCILAWTANFFLPYHVSLLVKIWGFARSLVRSELLIRVPCVCCFWTCAAAML
ncbi:hypothetical protein BJV77DRAFT_1792 [Russula vinacea]|nr:hypothetical protein BJV77DRAFT_1792 [Russula vinacea]